MKEDKTINTKAGIVTGQGGPSMGAAQSGTREYFTQEQAQAVKELFQRHLQSYKEKEPKVTDQEWLAQLLQKELPQMGEGEAEGEAARAIKEIEAFDANLKSCNEAAARGKSKESWLADKLQEAAAGMSASEYHQALVEVDQLLHKEDLALAAALDEDRDQHPARSSDLAEAAPGTKGAGSAVPSTALQGKDGAGLRPEINQPNSVAAGKATGEQGADEADESQMEGQKAKSKYLSKAAFIRALQKKAQSISRVAQLDFSSYQSSDLALYIGKITGVMALRAAAVAAGFNIASRLFKENSLDFDKEQLVELALETGVDTSLKTVTTGTLKVAVERGLITFIPKGFPLTIIACVGIENAKIMAKIAANELSVTKGLDGMGRVTSSTICGLQAMGKGAVVGAGLTAWIPGAGPPLAVVSGFVGGAVGYLAGYKFGEESYVAWKKVANSARPVAMAAMKTLTSMAKKTWEEAKSTVSLAQEKLDTI